MIEASYHSEIDTLSCSQFKIFCDSPMEYYHQFITRKMEKRKANYAMRLGTIEHALLLEKKSIDDICRAYPTTCLNRNGGLIGAKAKAFEAKIYPLIAAKDEQIERALAIYAEVMKSELGPILALDVQFEQRITATIAGVACRCKPDIHGFPEGICVINDLKVTERIHPDDFWRTAGQLGYFIQAAFYSLIAEAKYETPSLFRFWGIENKFPYRVKRFPYDDRSMELSKDYVKNKLEEFRERKAADNWEDNWNTTGVVTPWQLGANDDGEIVEWEDEYDEPGQGQ